MEGYSKVQIVDGKNVNEYLSKGWVIIATVKEDYGDGITTLLKYHLGYPFSKHLEELVDVVKEYEKLGFKEQLFKMKAEELGEDLEEYEETGYPPTDNELTDFLKKYEFAVNDKKVSYYKKGTGAQFNF